jgi:hypothetical protein
MIFILVKPAHYMLSPRMRRRYGLSLEGESGLDTRHENMLRHLDSQFSIDEMREIIPQIPGFSSLVISPKVCETEIAVPKPTSEPASKSAENKKESKELTPKPATNSEIRKKYRLPPPGPESISEHRVQELIRFDHKIITHKRDPAYKEVKVDWRQSIAGILAEQRFISAWTHNGFQQPGVKSVRGADAEEDKRKIDAVMEFNHGGFCFFQVKTGPADFDQLLNYGVIFVRVRLSDSPEIIRHNAIHAMIRYGVFGGKKKFGPSK